MNENTETPDASESAAADSRSAEYVADIGFDDLPLAEDLRRAIQDHGWTRPTPVQAKAFQPVVDGRDLIVRSKTGTGKTGAFGLPLLHKLPAGERNVRALIMCPTRELAVQVASELRDLVKYKDLKVTAIYGGASMRDQEDALEDGAAIVVGTPGRVYDHIRRGNLKLTHCDHAVLDEADEMLNQGFYEEVTRILDQLPKNRQVLLFSATVPEDIEKLIARYTTNAETILMSGDVFTVEHIHHVRYEISDAYPKPRNLIYVLEMEEPENAIIFCNTKSDTELVTAVLNRNGFDSELLNGDLPQKEREIVMGKVKRGEVALMVATDIAARGIDISGLQYVINYSLPEDPAVYLHRVGRTGRIGNKGTAINLTSGREMATLTVLEKKYGVKFERKQMPSPEEAAKMWTERHVREIKEASGSAVYEGYFGLASELRQRKDADDLIAFLLKYFFTHNRMDRVKERAPEPAFQDRPRRDRPERSERGDRKREPREARPREDRPSPGRRERGERPERSDARPERRSAGLEARAGQVKLWVGLGKSNNLDDSGLKQALKDLGAPEEKIVAVDVRPTFSYILVVEEDTPQFEALNGKNVGDRTLKIERARPPGEKPDRDARPRDLPGQARLWCNLSREQGFGEDSVKEAVIAAGAPADKLVRVSMRDTYCYVIVQEEAVEAYEALTGKAHGEHTLKLERARPRTERPPRKERAPRSSETPEETPGQARLWVGLGKGDAADDDALKTVLESLGAPSGKILGVSLRSTYAHVTVAEEDVAAFEALTGKTLGEKTVKIERARKH